jgi:Winged helix DNA-binding domain
MDGRLVARRRMHNLRLTGNAFGAAEDTVRWLGAVQSQDYGPAKWSLGKRTKGLSDADVDRAYAAGTILRTHVLRPTWHFVLPEDIRWLLELTGPRVNVTMAHHYRQAGLDDATLEKTGALLTAAVRGGNHLTRKEIAAVLAGAGIAASGPRLGFILGHAELAGLICSGERRGKQHTYALVEERAPDARSQSRDASLAELTLRYFTSHGPATVKDFRWWSSLTAVDIREGIEMAGDKLGHEVVDGVTFWFAPGPTPPEPRSPTVHLLQAYDEYIVGYTESKFVLDLAGPGRDRALSRSIFSHAVLLDGQLAGRWRRTLTKDSVLVEVALYAPLDDAQTRALRETVDRHGAFVGRTAEVVTSLL